MKKSIITKGIKKVTSVVVIITFLSVLPSFACEADTLTSDNTSSSSTCIIESDGKNVSTVLLQINSLEEIQSFVNEARDQNFENTEDKQSFVEAEKRIEDLFNSSTADLKNKYGLSIPEIKALNEIKNGKKEKAKKDKLNVKASGTLSQETCKVTVSVTDISTKKRPIYYDVVASFSWSKPSFFTFTDKVAIAWGGDLNLDSSSGTITHRKLNRNMGFESKGNVAFNLAPGEMEEELNRGCTYSVRMFKQDGYQAKSGKLSAKIYQTKKEGKESKVLVVYAHKKIAASGGISISYPPAITVGFGYDYTNPAVKRVIKY